MTLEEVKEHFVLFSRAMRMIGMSRTAYLNWRKIGYIPYHAQLKLKEASNGVLKVDGENKYAKAKKGYKPPYNKMRKKG